MITWNLHYIMHPFRYWSDEALLQVTDRIDEIEDKVSRI